MKTEEPRTTEHGPQGLEREKLITNIHYLGKTDCAGEQVSYNNETQMHVLVTAGKKKINESRDSSRDRIWYA